MLYEKSVKLELVGIIYIYLFGWKNRLYKFREFRVRFSNDSQIWAYNQVLLFGLKTNHAFFIKSDFWIRLI